MNRLAWFAALLMVGALAPARAEEVVLGSAPSSPVKAGFRVTISTQRLGNKGFQPLKLKFTAIGKSFTRQRELTLTFRPRTQYESELDFQYTCRVTVPQGVKGYETEVLIPQFHRWEKISVRVFEDGRMWGKGPSLLYIPSTVQGWGQNVSVGLVVPKNAAKVNESWARFPDVRSMVTVLGDGPIDDRASVARFNDKQARDYLDKLNYGYARFRILDEVELPSNWLAYSQLDILLIPYPVLARVELNDAERIEALKKWVSAGGQVWTYAAPPTVPEDRWLAASNGSPATLRYHKDGKFNLMLSQENDTSRVEYQAWNNTFSNAYNYNNNNITRRTVYEKLVEAKNPMVETKPQKEFRSAIREMKYGLGRIVLIEDDDPFPGSFQFWTAMETNYQNWESRQGVNYSNGNDSYWAWLMAAVGGPPVSMFVVLNGLFVLVMGPLLYFTLRRKSRLYLLYFLAPALAFLATGGLFMYAFISDGFDNRARVRQLTWVDARLGDEDCPIVNQSRQTYYTVVDSRQGLTYGPESLVLPVMHSELFDDYTYYPSNDRTPGDYLIDRVGDRRKYAGDFLPTRTQVHYLVTRPEIGRCPVEFLTDGRPVRVTNQLTTTIKNVGFRDADRKFWIANDVAPGATVEMKQVESNIFVGAGGGIIDPPESEMPVPYRARTSLTDRSMIEEHFQETFKNPPPNTFFVLTEVSESEFALRQCVEDDCVRFIGGFVQ